jgi:hypothetical protein
VRWLSVVPAGISLTARPGIPGAHKPHRDPRRGGRQLLAEHERPDENARSRLDRVHDRQAGSQRSSLKGAGGQQQPGRTERQQGPGRRGRKRQLVADVASQAGLVLANAGLIEDLRASR